MDEKTIARFWSKVDKLGPIPAHVPDLGRCWVWTASIRKGGYGHFRISTAERAYSHRVSFFLEHDRWPWPHALHRCDNARCVRPSHLFEGTNRDNTKDREAKGRGAKGEKCGAAKLNAAQVLAIRAALASGHSVRGLAREFGVVRTTVRAIARRQSWKAMP